VTGGRLHPWRRPCGGRSLGLEGDKEVVRSLEIRKRERSRKKSNEKRSNLSRGLAPSGPEGKTRKKTASASDRGRGPTCRVMKGEKRKQYPEFVEGTVESQSENNTIKGKMTTLVQWRGEGKRIRTVFPKKRRGVKNLLIIRLYSSGEGNLASTDELGEREKHQSAMGKGL